MRAFARHHGPRLRLGSSALQAKWKVSTAADEHERQADRMSRRVGPMSGSLQRSSRGGCAGRSEEPQGQSEPMPASPIGPSQADPTAPRIVDEVVSTGGQPLDPSTRAFMESGFGHDFSRVRVHADAKAGDSAEAVDARAYTVGRHVVFGPNQYAPGSSEGRQLLAHELTHVVQQSSPSGGVGGAVMRQPKPVETETRGCQPGQSAQINAVTQQARRAMNAAASVVGSAYGRPTGLSAAHHQLLLDHFHTTDHDDLRRILGTYLAVIRAFDSVVKFQCESTCDKAANQVTCGYAYNTQLFGGFGPIHICFDPAGCDFATTPAINRIALVIHEAAHRHAGVDDKVYRWQPGYATLSAKDAMDNADSYAWFAVLI